MTIDPKILLPALTLALAPMACADDDDGAAADDATSAATSEADTTTAVADASTSATADETGETGEPLDVDALYACEEPELVIGAPFAGPGYDPMVGLTGTPQSTYVAHTTQVMVRPGAEADFEAAVGQILGQLATTEGLVGFSLAIEPGCGFARTLGVWESEQAMYAFVGTGAHAVAMSQTPILTLTGRTTHWEIEAAEIPLAWDLALARIDGVPPFVYE